MVIDSFSGSVIPDATQSSVSGRRVSASSATVRLLRYGVSMNICVIPVFAAVDSSSRTRLAFSASLMGRYPLKENPCPLNPDAMSDIRMLEGPASGTVFSPSRCAMAATDAPGSATPGHPASLIMPTGCPFLSGSRKEWISLGSVCPFSSQNVQSPMGNEGSHLRRKRLAVRTFSTMK